MNHKLVSEFNVESKSNSSIDAVVVNKDRFKLRDYFGPKALLFNLDLSCVQSQKQLK